MSRRAPPRADYVTHTQLCLPFGEPRHLHYCGRCRRRPYKTVRGIVTHLADKHGVKLSLKAVK